MTVFALFGQQSTTGVGDGSANMGAPPESVR